MSHDVPTYGNGLLDHARKLLAIPDLDAFVQWIVECDADPEDPDALSKDANATEVREHLITEWNDTDYESMAYVALNIDRLDELARMTDAQREKIRYLRTRVGESLNFDEWKPMFDLPEDYVAGWAGGVYYGVDKEGRASS